MDNLPDGCTQVQLDRQLESYSDLTDQDLQEAYDELEIDAKIEQHIMSRIMGEKWYL